MATDVEPELSMSRQEILNTIDIWVSDGSGWTINRIESNYINDTTYRPLHAWIELQRTTKRTYKSSNRIDQHKDKDDECFRWCHIRHLNPQRKYPQRIKKDDKQYFEGLDSTNVQLSVSQKHYNKIETQNSIRINIFGHEEGQPFPIFTFLKKSSKNK